MLYPAELLAHGIHMKEGPKVLGALEGGILAALRSGILDPSILQKFFWNVKQKSAQFSGRISYTVQ